MSPNPQSIALSEERPQESDSHSQLDRRSSDGHDSILNDDSAPQQEFSLPQADGGLSAWLFLAGCFSIEALVWGFPFSFGIFQEYYSSNEPFKSDPSGIAAIGTSAMGIIYLGSPLCFAALQIWPFMRRISSYIGLVILIIALVSSSFSTAVWHLLLTQGVLYGIGGVLLYSPVIVFVDEWFVRRKGLAYGVMWGGTGFSGATVPFLMSWGLNRYSFPTMLRIWAVALAVLTGPLLYFVKPRIPYSQTHRVRRVSLGFMKDRTFIILQLGNVLQGLGFFIPTVYLPTYARSIGVQNAAVTATVALLNTANIFGCIFIGLIIDRFHVTTGILISTIGATFAVFVFWGISVSIPLLCVFSIVYGFFAGSFSATYAGIVREVRKDHIGADPGMVIGLLGAGRGIGSIVCGPLSEALLKGHTWEGRPALGYGTGYGLLIVFTGITAMLGGISFGARRIGWI